MSEIKRFTLRLPDELWDNMKVIADKNRRTVTSEIIIALEEYVKNNSKEQ